MSEEANNTKLAIGMSLAFMTLWTAVIILGTLRWFCGC